MVTINEGLHYHGIALTAPRSRCQEDLHVLIEDDLENYMKDKLQRIHVQPIRDSEEYVTDYLMKTLKRGRLQWDDIMLLPRVVSELPDNSPN